MTKKIIGTLSLFLFVLSIASGQCVSGDCMNGTGIYLFPSGAKYIGQFKSGKMDGIGSCYYTDGSKYQGEWEESYPQGNGIKTFADGTQQKGQFAKGEYQVPPPPAPEPPVEKVDAFAAAEPAAVKEEPQKEEQQTGCISGDCKNGKGIYIYPSGAIYIGEFKDGEIHGIGACHYSDGSKYQGEWVNRYPEGRGTKTLPDGSKWTGRWKKGQPIDENGQVVINLFPGREIAAEEGNGNIQTGCISGNCENGDGAFAYADGSKYEGQFAHGKPNGIGTFTHFDGDRYEGGFKDGFQHGKGALYGKNGSVTVGIWENGEYIGAEAVVEAPQWGCIQGDCKNGRGIFIRKEDGAKFTGSFRNGLPHGEGVMNFANGERYTGQWTDGNFDGKGTLVLMDGTEVKGYWSAGSYLGETQPEEQQPVELIADTRKLQRNKVWAVVVGVSAYNHMPTLRYTDDDAYRMYAFLKSPEGGALPDEQIRILIDEDATKDEIKMAMESVFSKAGKDDLVLLYFSGHGLKGAFLPIDFDGYNNKLEHDEINAILANSPAKYKLLIADACHSGSLLAMKGGEVKGILENYYSTLAQAEPGTALIMSSKSEETSLESSGLRQGVFSHFLIRGLKGEADADHNRVVTVQELFDYITENVRKYTGNRQSPVIKGDYDPNMPVSVVR
ncbi:MAG: caspase family protein [Lewinellaceae bacterium]|nr:caspase family protein [Lewinellaceae bacterium]